MNEAADVSVRAAAEQIRCGATTPVDLLEDTLARIRAVDPLVRAFAAFDEQQVCDAAVGLAEEARDGRHRGVLHGVPVAVKDVIDVAGYPTRGGSRATDAEPVSADSPAVARLRAAGALVLGKTHTHEFAHGVVTPPTRNPWDPQRIPGGSSGGSAAAVASGQCLAALGTDTGGSIRVPAALCGVSGLRPVPGDVPVDGMLPFSPRLDTCGPIARDALDLALLYEVLSGLPCPLRDSVTGMRIGTLMHADMGEVHDGIGAAVTAAIGVLADAGAATEPAAVPPFTAWSAPRGVYVLADFLDVHRASGRYPDRRADYGEEVAGYLEKAERITPAARAEAVDELQRLEERLRAGMVDFDALVLPTTPIPAPTAAECEYAPGADGRAGVIEPLMRLCGPFSWCGLAAVTVPCGTVDGDLPVGLQVVGRDVPTVLSVAAAYQRATTHHRRYPGG